MYYENYIIIEIPIPNFEEIKKKYFDSDGNKLVPLNNEFQLKSPFKYFTPVMYVDPSGIFPILACILGITALVGMGLTIGGVTSDNNIMTAIGLSLVAVPAFISGGIALAAGFAGATYLGILGAGTLVGGIGSSLFASAEYQEAFTGKNWIQSTGMSEEWYNGLMLASALIATI